MPPSSRLPLIGMVSAVIVAAGSSRRIGFDKLTPKIAGQPVVAHTVAAFEETDSVTEIIVVTRKERIPEFNGLLGSFKKLRAIVAGGEHRHNSVEAGLRDVSEGIKLVSVHDAARPLVTATQIAEVIEQARVHGAAALAEPVRDTLKRVNDELVVTGSVDRHRVYAMQTPQVFERSLLLEAYQAVNRTGKHVTDEVSAVELLGRQIVLVENAEPNFKITYPGDLRLAEAVLIQ
jgi:2-C-methyl-D-erythritol 4-phosphate cytidylyltransferase